jgi:predicted Zn-dependent protease
LIPTLVSLSLLAHAQDREQKQNTHVLSAAKEAALGAQLAGRVRRQSTPLGLIGVENYVANVGLRLAAQIPNAQESWKFSVIRDCKVGSINEPISLPGGWIFVPAELILAAHSEAEFAGMLAHSMAHVAERHGVQQASEVNNLATIPVIFLVAPGCGDENGLVPSAYLSTRRQFELDADQVAVKLLNDAGFDAASLRSYIERAHKQQTASPFSPLPPVSIRLNNLEQEIQDQAANGPYIISTDLFQSIQAEVRSEILNSALSKEAIAVPSLIHPKP